VSEHHKVYILLLRWNLTTSTTATLGTVYGGTCDFGSETTSDANNWIPPDCHICPCSIAVTLVVMKSETEGLRMIPISDGSPSSHMGCEADDVTIIL